MTQSLHDGREDCHRPWEVSPMLVNSQPPPQPLDGDPPVSATIASFIERAAALIEVDRAASDQLLRRAVALLRARRKALVPRKSPVLRVPGHTRFAPWQINRIFTHIENNLGSNLKAGDLASVIRLSQAHFFRCFKSSVGISPAQYIAQRRIELARQLMTRTDQSLTQIALACGFCDQAHFTKVFRRWVGATPYAWRRAAGSRRPPGSETTGVFAPSAVTLNGTPKAQ
jgi:AraC family transcriptional regulator